MPNVITAIDEPGATNLFAKQCAATSPLTMTGTHALGAFTASYKLDLILQSGPVDLIPPNTVRVARCNVPWKLYATLQLDLNHILPPISFPKITFTWKKWKLKISITWVQIYWPTITIPVHVSDSFQCTLDLGLIVRSDPINWYVSAEVQSVPALQFGAATAAIVAAVGLVLTPVLLAIPFIGLFLGVVTGALLAGITIAGVTGLLGPPVSAFLKGREIMFYQRPRKFPLLPYEGPEDGEVVVKLALVEATIVNAGEDELRVSATIQH